MGFVSSPSISIKITINYRGKVVKKSPRTQQLNDVITMETLTDFIFLAAKSLQMVMAAMKLKDTHSLEGKL